MVSPGPLEPGWYYQEVIRNGDYLMPQFTSAFILASDVKVYFPGLGVWNDTDGDDQTNNAINILMKYTYAPNLDGGYGPFSFVPANGANNVHNFRVERNRGGILITVPGAQVIGYVTNIISKFPDNQTLPNATLSCRELSSSSDHTEAETPGQRDKRRRRSTVTEEYKKDIPRRFDVMQLAKSLFSEKLSESDSFLHKNGLTPFQSVHRLMDEVATSKDRVMEFMEILNSEEKEGRTLGLTQRDPASVYHNGTASMSQQFVTSR